MNYIIPPRRKASDYAKGKITQNDIIALQIANDANIAKARKAVKMGEIEQLTPSQASSPEELLMDMANQEATARANVMKLGFRDNEASRIITDKFSGRSKGFGFIEMSNDEEAQKAIENLNGASINNRNAVVNEARPREERPRRDF